MFTGTYDVAFLFGWHVHATSFGEKSNMQNGQLMRVCNQWWRSGGGADRFLDRRVGDVPHQLDVDAAGMRRQLG